MAEGWAILYSSFNAAFALVLVASGALVLAGRRSRLNVLLTLYLVVYAVNIALFVVFYLAEDPFLLANAIFYAFVTATMIFFTYLAFLPNALTTPLLRPFRPRVVQAAFVVAALALVPVALVAPAWTSATLQGFDPMLSLGGTGVALFATIASVSALRGAPSGSLIRRRAKAYLLAFVCNDVSIIAGFGGSNFGRHTPMFDLLLGVVAPVFGIAFVLLLTRALLRDQLFDFDLKLKLTLKRGTVAAAFVGVFLVVAQVASNYLQGALGWLMGGIAAGALLLLLRPIERAADKLADRAMPNVQDNAEYRTVKKREVYRAAIESAMEDGVVTDKERNVLATLADQLGLGAKETLDIEREARTARGVT